MDELLLHPATRAGSAISFVAGLPVMGVAALSGEWSALVVGTAAGIIGGSFAIVGIIRDKQIASLRRQIDGLEKEAQTRSDKWMEAEARFDDLSIKLQRALSEIRMLKTSQCPFHDEGQIPCDPAKPRPQQ